MRSCGAAQEALLTAAKRDDAASVKHILTKTYIGEGQGQRLLECADERWDKTPLQWAANHGCNCALRALIDAGGNVNRIRGKDGFTALQGAAQNGHAGAVKMLLETGNVNTGHKNNAGETASDVARRRGHREVAALLSQWDYHETSPAAAVARLSTQPSRGPPPAVLLPDVSDSGASPGAGCWCGRSELHITCSQCRDAKDAAVREAQSRAAQGAAPPAAAQRG